MQSNLSEVTEIDLENIKTKNNKKKIDEEKR